MVMVNDGDGSNRTKSKNLVLIVTDGLEPYKLRDNSPSVISPINPRWCDPVKAKGVLSIVYTPYRPIVDNAYALDITSEAFGTTLEYLEKDRIPLAYHNKRVIAEIKKRIARRCKKRGHASSYRRYPLHALYSDNQSYAPDVFNCALVKEPQKHDALYPMLGECANNPKFAAMEGTKSENEILESLKDILGRLGALLPHLLN